MKGGNEWDKMDRDRLVSFSMVGWESDRVEQGIKEEIQTDSGWLDIENESWNLSGVRRTGPKKLGETLNSL